jgi:hypothetical protein
MPGCTEKTRDEADFDQRKAPGGKDVGLLSSEQQ